MHVKSHIWIVIASLLAGCVCCHDPLPNPCDVCVDPQSDPCRNLVAQIEYPDVARCDQSLILDSGPPRQLSDGIPQEFWDVTLEEAVRIGLQNTRILRDLGGRVLSSPQGLASVYDPSITMSHPRVGEEAALAAFDAQYQGSFVWNRSHQAFNNAVAGGGATEVSNDGFTHNSQIIKTAATGTQFSLSRLLQYDNTVADPQFNQFPSSYSGAIQATVRQPLLQGAGVAFNRITGPRGNVDLAITRGILLARLDGDISIARFERGVRDFVRDLETAYWQLYFAYRTLDAFQTGRDASRTTWQTVEARYQSDLRGGEADQEAQSREQMFAFEQRVLQALNGSPVGRTTGVYLAERNLRRMMGLPVNDGRLIRPAEEPAEVPVSFDWQDCLTDALVRRVELREQMWRVKQRELELIAAKNFLLPRLDAIASMRFDGFGDDLAGGSDPFESLTRELFSFDNNQSQVGLQFAVPLGFRREIAGVRHSKLTLCRERAVLQEQELLVSHNLGAAFVGVETAFDSIQLTKSRLIAAEEVVQSREVLFETGKVPINRLLESQRRLTDAQVNYYEARTDYALAIRNLHFEKGTLLPYNGVHLQEGPWPSQACQQSWYERRRWVACNSNRQTLPSPVSLGPFDAAIDGTGVVSADADYTAPTEATMERLPDVETMPAPTQDEPQLGPLLPNTKILEPRLSVPELNQPPWQVPDPLPVQDPFLDDPRSASADPAPLGATGDTLIQRVRWLRLMDGDSQVQPAVLETINNYSESL